MLKKWPRGFIYVDRAQTEQQLNLVHDRGIYFTWPRWEWTHWLAFESKCNKRIVSGLTLKTIKPSLGVPVLPVRVFSLRRSGNSDGNLEISLMCFHHKNKWKTHPGQRQIQESSVIPKHASNTNILPKQQKTRRPQKILLWLPTEPLMI